MESVGGVCGLLDLAGDWGAEVEESNWNQGIVAQIEAGFVFVDISGMNIILDW